MATEPQSSITNLPQSLPQKDLKPFARVLGTGEKEMLDFLEVLDTNSELTSTPEGPEHHTGLLVRC